MRFRVDDALFERFPDLAIGVVIAAGIDNRRHGEAAAAFLRERVDAVRSSWSLDSLEADPRIAAWREAYRSFGAKPKKYRCSVENMIRTILDGGELPPINAAVATYNAISLKHCVPSGGDDLDRVVGDIVLTFAEGGERFVPLNGTESRPPKPGEVIYRDDEDVLCRRWNWRECDKSKMTAESRNLCLVVEGLPPVSAKVIGRISAELREAIATFCGGSTSVRLVDRHAPEVQIRTA
jgi:DNA/RNA-binding domain of Phe-tRNA-synthetase-like protein